MRWKSWGLLLLSVPTFKHLNTPFPLILLFMTDLRTPTFPKSWKLSDFVKYPESSHCGYGFADEMCDNRGPGINKTPEQTGEISTDLWRKIELRPQDMLLIMGMYDKMSYNSLGSIHKKANIKEKLTKEKNNNKKKIIIIKTKPVRSSFFSSVFNLFPNQH